MLDFGSIIQSLQSFSQFQRQATDDRNAAIDAVITLLNHLSHQTEWQSFQKKSAEGHELIALPLENPANRYSAPERPKEVTLCATDGSQIYPDRHIEPTCYLLNISQMVFRYGRALPPTLKSYASLHHLEQDKIEYYEKLNTLSRDFVSARRDEQELQQLLHISQQEEGKVLALADGTLIRWNLNALQDKELEDFLTKNYVKIISEFAQDQIPLASYISLPSGKEVKSLLEQFGYGFESLIDRFIFEHWLRIGERSALFGSQSKILSKYGNQNHICFFYTKFKTRFGTEVGRVEIPFWMTQTKGMIDFVHACILDEVEKGNGFPIILQEAHEKAVIRTADQEQFYRLLERELFPFGGWVESAKQRSKKKPLI